MNECGMRLYAKVSAKRQHRRKPHGFGIRGTNGIRLAENPTGVGFGRVYSLAVKSVVLWCGRTELAKQGENHAMSKPAKLDLSVQILGNGTARYTASALDSGGNAVALPAGTKPLDWESGNPKALHLHLPDPAELSGFDLVRIGIAKGVASDIVVTCSTSVSGVEGPLVATAIPVNTVVGGGASGFSVELQNKKAVSEPAKEGEWDWRAAKQRRRK